jgi:hypothetical protein
MSKFSNIFFSSTASILLSTTASFADVTSAEAWEFLQKYMTTFGYTVEATEANENGSLSVTDIILSNPNGYSMTMPTLTFAEQSDGSVKILQPAKGSLAFNTTLETGETVNLTVGYTQDGTAISVSGEDGAFTYDHVTSAFDLTLENLVVDGTTMSSSVASAALSLKDIKSDFSSKSDDLNTYSQSMSVGQTSYDVAFSEPGTQNSFKATGSLNDLASTGTGTIPDLENAAGNPNAIFAAGLDVDGTMTYQGGSMDLSFETPDGSGTANTTSTGGTFVVAIGPNGISYDLSQKDLTVDAALPTLPLPISFNMADAKLNLAMPIQKSDEEQDFAFGLTMGDFEMSDLIWGLFDASAQLPRDPATIALDLSGKAKLLFDLFDPDQAAALEASNEVPGELNALTLNKLLIDAVGTQLTGTGDFTFDNSDLESFDGLPRPTGAIDLKLVGGNGLLDKLVAMGLLPQNQASGARLMMGLFATAGTEPDTLNSKLEINDAGHILANGQRIQ